MDKYSLQVPTTFDEMKAACDKITAGENDSKLACFAGQYNKYEGLTVNFDEAVHGAGGVIVGDDGKPNVATPEATKGLQTLTDWFKDGHIPKAAITWTEEEGRKAFQDGELIFHRNWPYVYAFAAKTDGSSKVNGKFEVAPLPGITQPGVSSLGGGNLGIAKNAENKGTAADFLKFMASEEAQKQDTLATSNAPALESLYSDPDIVKKFPYTPTLLKSIQTAKPRPKAVRVRRCHPGDPGCRLWRTPRSDSTRCGLASTAGQVADSDSSRLVSARFPAQPGAAPGAQRISQRR